MTHTPPPAPEPATGPAETRQPAHPEDIMALTSRRKALLSIAAGSLLTASSTTFAHGSGAHGAAGGSATAAPEQKRWGIAGRARDVRRTITIRMLDTMRFVPDHITVREGETVRLRVINEGRLLHELVLGDAAELAAHAELMKKHPGMEHDEAWMAHVDPGRRGELVWHFNRAGRFQFACLIPGHFDAGMVGSITVEARR